MSLHFTHTTRTSTSQLPDRIQLDPRVAGLSFALAVSEVMNRVDLDDRLENKTTNRPTR